MAGSYPATGSNNTADGYQALYSYTTGNYNTATGALALAAITTGSYSTATGYKALTSATGDGNTANGYLALFGDTTGFNNTGIGNAALYGVSTGSNNVGLGTNAGLGLTTGNFNIDIGNIGAAGDTGIIRIGTAGSHTATFIAGIRGVAVAGAQPVGVNPNGQLGVRASSARFKESTKPMGEASEAILSLKPVSFRYKKELDPQGVPQFGLVAEEVAKVNRDLVVTDEDGRPLSVRYEEVNAMLLNEFLKEHRKVEKLETALAEQGKRLVGQENEIKALSTSLQKVSKQLATASPSHGGLELTEPTQRVAENSP